MADIFAPLKQQVADGLLRLEKFCKEPEKVWYYPRQGHTLEVPLKSRNGREEFTLDIEKHRVTLSKFKVQTRGRRTVVLARLDFGGPPHQNPNGTRIDGSHLHLHNEVYGDKVAVPLSQLSEFALAGTIEELIEVFMTYCNIIQKPVFQKEVFV